MIGNGGNRGKHSRPVKKKRGDSRPTPGGTLKIKEREKKKEEYDIMAGMTASICYYHHNHEAERSCVAAFTAFAAGFPASAINRPALASSSILRMCSAALTS